MQEKKVHLILRYLKNLKQCGTIGVFFYHPGSITFQESGFRFYTSIISWKFRKTFYNKLHLQNHSNSY